jgi:hypothetical protein
MVILWKIDEFLLDDPAIVFQPFIGIVERCAEAARGV